MTDPQPYTGPNLGPLQRGAPTDSWDAFPPAPSGSDSWDAFPEAPKTSALETAKDVAKSAGVGVAKGAIGVAGMVGDISNLGAKGIKAASDFVSDQIGTPRYESSGDSVLNNIPTSKSITDAVEARTGPFYKPKTTAGKYAETIGEYVPAAMAGPGSIGRKLVLQAAIPGVASETAGELTQGTDAEPYARAGAGILAGGAAALLSRPSSTTSAIQSQLPEGITQATVDDARSLMLTAKDKGIALTWPEALSQVSGRPVLSDTQRILESAPASRTRMQEFYADRPRDIDQAGLNEFDRIAPASATPSTVGPAVGNASNEVLGDVRKKINDAAEPFYQASEGVLLTPAEMTHVKAIPGYAEARDAVRNNPQLNWRVAHLPDNSVGFLNEVKKQFDQQAENAGSKFNQGRNRQVQSSNEMAASVLKEISAAKSGQRVQEFSHGTVVWPETHVNNYEAALAIQQQAREKYLQPLLDGPLGRLAKKDMTTQRAINALFPSNPLPNSQHEIATAVSALAKKNPTAARQLVRAHVESVFNEATRQLQGGANQFGGAAFAKALVGNMQQRANLEAAIESLPNGRALWDSFDNFLEAVEATGTRQGKGSLTAFNAQELKAMSGSNPLGEAVKTGLSPGKWWSVVNDKWSQWKLGRNLDQLAQIFTDPKSAPVLKRIVAMPSRSREAGYLASRLIIQAENAAVQPREPRRQ